VFREIKNIKGLRGIRVYETNWMISGSGICLPGLGIFIHSDIRDQSKERIIQHEYGHFLDYQHGLENDQKVFLGSKLLGFYLLIGIPSLFNLIPMLNRIPLFEGEHRYFWTETRANRLAKEYFGAKIAENFDRYFPSQLP
jgi:hypothetical protein